MQEPIIPTVCSNPGCSGTGYVGGELCPVCYGQGSEPLIGVMSHIAKKVKSADAKAAEAASGISTIEGKIDALQASVTAIWDILPDGWKQ